MPPPYPGPFIPGQTSDVVPSSPPVARRVVFTDGGAADEACGGVDTIKYPLDDDDDGYFVPDAVEMNAKLVEAIPPPPHLSYDLRAHQRPEQRPRHGVDAACFVPDDDTPPCRRHHRKSAAYGSSSPVIPGWRRQMSTSTGRGTGSSVDTSGTLSSAGFTRSLSIQSPPSLYLPSTASSTSSSQSYVVHSDDSDTTQTSVDYY